MLPTRRLSCRVARRASAVAVSLALAALAGGAGAAPQFEPLGAYATGLAHLESSGETAALRGDRLYVTNAKDVSLDIVDVADPTAPRLLKRVDLRAWGAGVNSVAVSSKNLIAVALQAQKKTDPGTIVFLTPDGTVKRSATVGALPDMVTFTHDGRRLLVANEGEPDCYGAGCTDPEGTVSIIDVVPMKPELEVRTVSFAGVPLPAGVRIFGPGASAAQDLEPEYITVGEDDRTAYVTLQENNAIAVIDIDKARVTEVRALGYKDFNAAPQLSIHELKDLPLVGTTAAGQSIALGGFSGLHFEGRGADGKLHFITHTDRGPNGEPTGINRPFLLPDFTPRLVRLTLDPATGAVELGEQILLRRGDGTPLTGLPNTALSGDTNAAYNDEVPVDLRGKVLPLDPLGGDFEGIAVDTDGSFWLADEYRPAIYHFDPSGRLLDRFVPVGTAAAAGKAAGTFGTEALPAVLAQRRQNRGFEAIVLQGGKLYAFVQSPLRNPAGLANSALNAMKNVRVVEFDPVTRATRQFIYIMDNPAATGADDTRADKIGDAAALPGGGFLVVERDDDARPDDALATITKKVYAFSLTGATDISTKDTLYTVGGVSKSLDQMTANELSSVGVKPVAKVLHVDLASAGYNAVQKVEGLAVIDADTIALINDNDFGVAQINIDAAAGSYTLAPGYTPEPVQLGILRTGGLDASDKDNVVNIRNWPLRGMYQPDAIASYTVGGQRYLVTANEGDARDYPGFAEEARAKSLKASYPNLPEVADDLQLGRLTVTSVPPAGGVPYVFGTRSFSIWNATTGAQVWDSGSELEVRTAAAFPKHFNSNNDENNFDNRSDNKGPEPEGVAVGTIGNNTYAFVGLERIGGVMVYDVTRPAAPAFVQYLHSRNFAGSAVGPDSGPEIVRFIAAKDSPTGKPMVVVANEISGTVNLWGLGAED
ncbi:choice-of-anchor I domain-containing protein [Azoarcus olearius]|uniref:Conserved hypothetical secreted protein n=1 Tax=Azoarcus sp. (strain BH72) TaxID=418699 RepID=A1K2M4_AZOSB|nr:esterase-like activity of phytase family protein [Azoarcus olearius]CAL93079.1 conserved hypothetical secreted protein [Azoarcus olearius]